MVKLYNGKSILTAKML